MFVRMFMHSKVCLFEILLETRSQYQKVKETHQILSKYYDKSTQIVTSCIGKYFLITHLI